MGPYFGFAISPQLDIMSTRFAVDFTMGRDWFAGDSDYEHLALSAAFHSRPEVVKLDTRVRVFGGFAGGGAPTQRKFNLAGGGPMEQEKRFWAPTGIKLDAAGRLYIVESCRHRVQIYETA